MGVDERLMAHTEAEAEELFARIKARQAGPSPEGAQLTHALLLVMEHKLLVWRALRPLAPILVPVLNGDETAAMLGLDVRHHALVVVLHRLTAAGMRLVQFLINPFSQAWQPGPPLAARFGRRVLDFLVRATDDGRVRQVAMPGMALSDDHAGGAVTVASVQRSLRGITGRSTCEGRSASW